MRTLRRNPPQRPTLPQHNPTRLRRNLANHQQTSHHRRRLLHRLHRLNRQPTHLRPHHPQSTRRHRRQTQPHLSMPQTQQRQRGGARVKSIDFVAPDPCHDNFLAAKVVDA
jgi:hypothetical protein